MSFVASLYRGCVALFLLQTFTHALYIGQQLHAGAGLPILVSQKLVSQIVVSILYSHGHSLLRVPCSL